MKREAEKNLKSWLTGKRRKPLVLRGARQVGKSTLVKNFAAAEGLVLNEINLERHLELKKVFASFDINRICAELDVLVGRSVRAPGSILFLDEIQAVPEAIAALRYFYEDLPQLPVIAAGSLLEFALSDHRFSMPVGRIDYLHLGPMTFREFVAETEAHLLPYLQEASAGQIIPESAHAALMKLVRTYSFVGGMPEAVLAFLESGSAIEAVPVHRSILQTYEDDFPKYAPKVDTALMQSIFRKIPAVVGQKVKYVNFARDVLSRDVKAALNCLMKARVCAAVYASSCSALPLEASLSDSAWKLLFLDVGLMNHACGVDSATIEHKDDIRLINEGAIAEQFVGQHLLYRSGGLETPSLCYWLRENRNANAEVDYVISFNGEILPIEVKAGAAGTMRSLKQFALEKNNKRALRFDANQASRQIIDDYELTSLPLYTATMI